MLRRRRRGLLFKRRWKMRTTTFSSFNVSIFSSRLASSTFSHVLEREWKEKNRTGSLKWWGKKSSFKTYTFNDNGIFLVRIQVEGRKEKDHGDDDDLEYPSKFEVRILSCVPVVFHEVYTTLTDLDDFSSRIDAFKSKLIPYTKSGWKGMSILFTSFLIQEAVYGLWAKICNLYVYCVNSILFIFSFLNSFSEYLWNNPASFEDQISLFRVSVGYFCHIWSGNLSKSVEYLCFHSFSRLYKWNGLLESNFVDPLFFPFPFGFIDPK